MSSNATIILNLEKKHPLLYSYKYKGIPIWEITRYPLFFEMENYAISKKGSKLKFSFALFEKFISSFFLLNPFFYLSKKNVLIFRCSRKSFIDAEWIDVYTEDIRKKYKSEELGIYETGSTNNNKKERYPKITVIKSFALRISSILCRFFPLNSDEINLVSDIIAENDIPVDFHRVFSKEYYTFKIENLCYQILLSFRQPNVIYLVNYVDKLALIYTAKKKRIDVYEMQHGFTSPSLLLYNFPFVNENELMAFPTHFCYINEDYIYSCAIPIIKQNIIPNQSSYLLRDNVSFSPNPDPYSILFVSQHFLHAPFLEFLKSFCTVNAEDGFRYNVYYKPHPSEYEMFEEGEMEMLKLRFKVNVIEKMTNIYDSMKNVKHVIGVYTTVLIEARNGGASIYLINIRGVEHFEHLIKKYDLPLVSHASELITMLNKSHN